MSKKSPQLRFEGFTDDWEERKLKNVSTFKQGIQVDLERQYQIQNDHLIRFIRIVDYTQNTQDIRYIDINTSKNIIQPDDIIMVRYGATAGFIGRGIEGILANNMFSINPTQKIVKDYLYIYLKQDKIYKQLNNSNGSSAMPAINFSLVGNLNITYPNFEEQEKIGTFFKQLDDTIDLHQRKLDLLKEQKKGFLQKMFPKNGAKVPELRFAGFADDWEERKLGDLLNKNSEKNKNLSVINVESVSNKTGFTKQTEQFEDYSVASADLSNYYVIREKQFAYNPSRINVGSIAYKDLGDEISVVSPLYVSFSTKKILNDGFLWNWFKTASFDAQRQRLSEGGVRDTLSFNQLSEMNTMFPTYSEQQKIGSFFKQIDDTIALHQRKLDLLKEQKKGFLQKMFV